MELYTIWGYDPDFGEWVFAEAWSEFDLDCNYEGWTDKLAEIRGYDQYEEVRVVVVDVPDAALGAVLARPHVTATVRPAGEA